MNDSKRIIVVIPNEYPVPDRRKVHGRLNRVSEIACQFSENLSVFISYEVAVSVHRSYTRYIAVRSLRFQFFILKPLIKSERSKFHISDEYISA